MVEVWIRRLSVFCGGVLFLEVGEGENVCLTIIIHNILLTSTFCRGSLVCVITTKKERGAYTKFHHQEIES